MRKESVDSRRKLLILWGTYMFKEQMLPIVPKFAQYFKIYFVTIEYSTPVDFCEIMDGLIEKNIIEEYCILPSMSKALDHHRALKRYLSKWQHLEFDAYLTIQEMILPSRCLLDLLLHERCLKVCFFPFPTYLLLFHPALSASLLEPSIKGNNAERYRTNYILVKAGKQLKDVQSFSDMVNYLTKIVKHVQKKITYSVSRRYDYFLNRYLLPYMFLGKIFPYGKYDEITQIGSGRSDAYIFCDEIESKVFDRLVPRARCLTAEYPTHGLCRCNGLNLDKLSALIVLSIFNGMDRIGDEYLETFSRDILTVLSETGANEVHLRPHPSETGGWVIQLMDYLQMKGVNVVVKQPVEPLWKIVCNYVCVAGPESASLRDARAACDYVLVIGFVGISKFILTDPKFGYGKSEGIGWIEEDGSYDKSIFIKKQYIAPERKNIVEHLKDLSDEKTKSSRWLCH